MFKKTNQSGRSMVEMIAVLAIMGILSIGGLSGINYIKNKNVANKIQKEVLTQASELKTRHRLGADIDPDNGGEVPYHYGSEFVASRFYTPGTKTLAIRADASRKVCEMLQLNPPDIFACISTTSVTCCGNITTDCAEQNTMTFVIDDMSLIPGGGEPVDPCKDVTCPNDNYTCAAGVCICKTGYFGEDCSGECPTPEEGCHKETMTDSNGCTVFKKTSCTQEGQVCNMTDGSCYCGKGECINTGKCLTNEKMYDANGNKIENPTSESTGNCCSSTQEWVPGAGIDGEGRCKDFCPTENGAGRDATTHECLCATGYQLSEDKKTCELACEFGYCLNQKKCLEKALDFMFDENGNKISDPTTTSRGYCCPINYSAPFEWVKSANECLKKCPSESNFGVGSGTRDENNNCLCKEGYSYDKDSGLCSRNCDPNLCEKEDPLTGSCIKHTETEYCCEDQGYLWYQGEGDTQGRCLKEENCTPTATACALGASTVWCCSQGNECGKVSGICCKSDDSGRCCSGNLFCVEYSGNECIDEDCCTGTLVNLNSQINGAPKLEQCCYNLATPYCTQYDANGLCIKADCCSGSVYCSSYNTDGSCKTKACCTGGVRKINGKDACCNSSGQTPYCSSSYYNKTTGQCSSYSCCSSGYKVLTMPEGFEYCIYPSYLPYCKNYNSDGSCSRYYDCYTSDPNRIKQINGMDVCCGSSSQTPFCKNSSCSDRACCSGKVISTGGGKVCCTSTSGSSYCSSYSSSDPSKCSTYACCSGSSTVKKLGNLDACCASTGEPYCTSYNSEGECYKASCCSSGQTSYCSSYNSSTLQCTSQSCCSSSNTKTTYMGLDVCHSSSYRPYCNYTTSDGSKCRDVETCYNSSTIVKIDNAEACCSSSQKGYCYSRSSTTGKCTDARCCTGTPYCASLNSNGTCNQRCCASSNTLKLNSDGKTYTCKSTSSCTSYTTVTGSTASCCNYVKSISGVSGKSVCCSGSNEKGYCSQYNSNGVCIAAACCSATPSCYQYSSGKCVKQGCCSGGTIYCSAVDGNGTCNEQTCCKGTVYCADGTTTCTVKKCCTSGKTVRCTAEDDTGKCIAQDCA